MTKFFVEIDVIADGDSLDLFDNLQRALRDLQTKDKIRSHYIVVNTNDGEKMTQDDYRDIEALRRTK